MVPHESVLAMQRKEPGTGAGGQHLTFRTLSTSFILSGLPQLS